MAKRISKSEKILNRSSLASFKALYDAAGYGRRMKGWTPPSSGPNKAVVGLQNIRNRSRDASRNDWSGESLTQKWTTSLIGVGITPRFKRVINKSRKQFITDLWNDFVSRSDADGVLNYYGQQTLAVRSWIESGEVFARRRYRRATAGLPVPMQVQLIEAEFVPLLDSDTWPGLPKGHTIRSGIELDKSQQRVAYWVHKAHPGDGQVTLEGDMLVRVLAADMRHIFEPKRPGQLRGVSAMAPVLARLRNINDYDDAVLERQKLANLFVAFITRTMPGFDAELDIDPLTNLPIEWEKGAPLAGMQPGMSQELDPGQDVKFANPPEAGTTYSEYMRTANMGTAAASGIPYEVFSGDIANVSDRTLRVIIQEFRRFAEQRQWQIIIPMFCQPVVEWFAEAARVSGQISDEEFGMVRRAEHAPHGWSYIHPIQDPQGKALEVTSGFRSRSSVIAERGDDPESVDDERKSDKDREDNLGLTPVTAVDTKGTLVPKPEQDPGKKVTPTQFERALTGLIASQIHAMQKPHEPAPVPVNNIVVNNPANVTNVSNHVEPTPVSLTTVVKPTPLVVNNLVEPTPVNVSAPNVNLVNNVAPAEVKVVLPTRKTETTVEYDAKGNIVSTSQIESDAEQ